MYPTTHEITVTTDDDGNGTGYSTDPARGRVLSVRYVKDSSAPYSDGSTMTATGETTGIGIWTEAAVNASATRCPRQATHSTAGAAALYASGGTAVLDYVVLAFEHIKIVLSAGGKAKTGKFYVTVG